MSKYILGIETSCDDTSIALVSEDGNILSERTRSQYQLLNQYGGVYPEFASRAHVVNIIPAIDSVISSADLNIEEDIAAIAVTRGPGLIGSLIIGVNTALTLGKLWKKEVIGVNHLRGHLKSAELEGARIEYPALVLLVSGGHTFLTIIDPAGDVTLLGQTRDDSLGEAYDKVGRMLNLEFPAGPKIDKLALQGNASIKFPTPLINKGYEFSFSGLKSSVSRYLSTSEQENILAQDVSASFVHSVLTVLESKLRSAIKKNKGLASLVVVGGVAASKQIRDLSKDIADDYGLKLNLPPLKWATDNGAMIALAGWDYLKKDKIIPPNPIARIPIYEY